MKRLALILALALPMFAAAPDKWWDAYNRGVAAVRARNYAAAADDLQRAIGEIPAENGAIRARNEIITYVPHFWLGIAKYNLGDIDGSLREFKTSEDQGVVQSTQYYAQLRDWVARAQQQKKRDAEASAADSRKAADAAISHALSGQMEAVAAGGDRSESYRGAKQKLQEALDQFNHAGTNITQYKRAGEIAAQARELFVSAAEEAKKAKAARPTPAPPVAKPIPVTASIPTEPKKDPPPPAPAPVVIAPPPVAVESEALVSARVALQQYRRKLLESGSASTSPALQTYLHDSLQETYRLDHRLSGKPSEEEIRRVADQVAIKNRELVTEIDKAHKQPVAVKAAMVAPPVIRDPRADLELAYRAFATGDFDTAESLLTKLLGSKPEAQAYALRGCARYTRGMLSRKPDALLASATADFRAALKLRHDLRLDKSAFSPKLVAYFEALR
jgi:tetratricopeptide (TPR) repeat protein